MRKNIFVIGIAGGSGSGKTTIAMALQKQLQTTFGLLSLDSYYHANSQLSLKDRQNINFDHPQSFDIQLLLQHLEDLRHQKPIQIPSYSYIEKTRLPETIVMYPPETLLIEGLYVLYFESLRKELDLKIFIESSENLMLERIEARDTFERAWTTDEIRTRFKKVVLPMYRQLNQPTKQFADIIIQNQTEKIEGSLLDPILQAILKHNKKHKHA